MEVGKRTFLYETVSPGLLYLTIDGGDPVQVIFNYKVKLEVCLSHKNVQVTKSNTREEDGKRNLMIEENESGLDDEIADTEVETCVASNDVTNIPSSKSPISPRKKDPTTEVSGSTLLQGTNQSNQRDALYGPQDDETSVVTEKSRSAKPQSKTIFKEGANKSKKRNNVKTTRREKSPLYLKTDEEPGAGKLETSKELKQKFGIKKNSRLHIKKDKSLSIKSERPRQSKEYPSRQSKQPNNAKAEPVTCRYCSVTFPSKREYARHTQLKGERIHACDHCPKVFLFKAYLLVHVKRHTQDIDQYLVCDLCGKKHRNVTDLKGHMLNHTGEHAYQCCQCKKTMGHHKNLRSHLGLHRRAGLIKCSCCNQRFSSRAALAEHKMSVLEIKCGLCGQEFPNRMSRLVHYKTDHQEDILRCHVCKRMFSTQKELEEHTAHHFERQRKQCPVCGRMVTNIRNHVLTHKPLEEMDESELWMCDKCPGKFRTKAVLLAHTKTAHGNDKQNCHLCPTSFKTRQGLSRHLNSVHSTLMPYECEVCGKRCKVKSNLRIHMRTHSDVKLFPCNFCTQAFNYKSSLDGHMRSKHPTEPMPLKQGVTNAGSEECNDTTVSTSSSLIWSLSGSSPSVSSLSRDKHTTSTVLSWNPISNTGENPSGSTAATAALPRWSPSMSQESQQSASGNRYSTPAVPSSWSPPLPAREVATTGSGTVDQYHNNGEVFSTWSAQPSSRDGVPGEHYTTTSSVPTWTTPGREGLSGLASIMAVPQWSSMDILPSSGVNIKPELLQVNQQLSSNIWSTLNSRLTGSQK